MAEEGTLAIRDNIIKEAVLNHNTTFSYEAHTNYYIKKAEGKLCLDTRFDWVDKYSDVSTIGKEVLREAVSCYAEIAVIKEDMKGFTSRQEALIMINILWTRYIDVVKRIVNDAKYKTFIKTAEGDID